MKHLFCVTIISLLSNVLCSAQWVEDILANGYEQFTITHDKEKDSPVSTIIRKNMVNNTLKTGVLYIHGYNDYFFQSEMGERFIENNIAFYAIDLRNYGRSIRNHDIIFDTSDISEYYADIEASIQIMKDDGISNIILIGHSTGGLIATRYMQVRDREEIIGLILNSPFFEWNLSPLMKDIAIPVASSMSHLFPNMSFSQGNSTAYGESLHLNHHGEWLYNLDWKMMPSPKVKTRWLNAINKAHSDVETGRKISKPILLMHSDKTIIGETWNESFQTGDAVLNVDDISRIGRTIGFSIREATVKDGLHDLLLSRKDVRDATYNCIFKWISEITAINLYSPQ